MNHAIEEPANEFESAVNDWYALRKQIADLKAKLKPLESAERKQRDAIAESLRTYFADRLKEGVNNYELSNGRKLKLTHKVDRKLEVSMLALAREEYGRANDTDGLAFEDVIEMRPSLNLSNYRKVGSVAATALSHMITSKLAAPTLEVD